MPRLRGSVPRSRLVLKYFMLRNGARRPVRRRRRAPPTRDGLPLRPFRTSETLLKAGPFLLSKASTLGVHTSFSVWQCFRASTRRNALIFNYLKGVHTSRPHFKPLVGNEVWTPSVDDPIKSAIR
jgi:hypothetical protein